MVRAEPAGSRETNAQEEALYETTHSSFDAGAVWFGRLRRRTSARNHDHDHGGHDNDRPGRGHTRGVGDTNPASCSSRGANRLTRTKVCLDERLLALERDGLCVGAGKLGCASQTGRGLGGRTLGPPSGWLDLDRRTLAIVKRGHFPLEGRALRGRCANGVAESRPPRSQGSRESSWGATLTTR
jgi:hypothetical protein